MNPLKQSGRPLSIDDIDHALYMQRQHNAKMKHLSQKLYVGH